MIVETVRLHRRGPKVRVEARSLIAGHPVPLHRQPRHVLFWIVGVGGTVTFLPQSHAQWCGKQGCSTVTDGILRTDPPVSAVWPYDVPLGQPFSVRKPTVNSLGRVQVMNGSQAAEPIVIGLFFDVLAVLIVIMIISEVRRQRRSRNAASAPAASAA